MGKSSVAEFASALGLPAELLLEQLKGAGVNKAALADELTEQDKTSLLEYLREEHGGQAPKNKITLIRKQVTEIKKSDSTGKARTIQVEVRKKRVLVRREIGTEDESSDLPVAEPESLVSEVQAEKSSKISTETTVAELEAAESTPDKTAAKTKITGKNLLSAEQIAMREQEGGISARNDIGGRLGAQDGS